MKNILTLITLFTLLACNPTGDNDRDPRIGVAASINGETLRTVIPSGSTVTETLEANDGDEIFIVATGVDGDGVVRTQIEAVGALLAANITDAGIPIMISSNTPADAVSILFAAAHVKPTSRSVDLTFEAEDRFGNIGTGANLRINYNIDSITDCSPDSTANICIFDFSRFEICKSSADDTNTCFQQIWDDNREALTHLLVTKRISPLLPYANRIVRSFKLVSSDGNSAFIYPEGSDIVDRVLLTEDVVNEIPPDWQLGGNWIIQILTNDPLFVPSNLMIEVDLIPSS